MRKTSRPLHVLFPLLCLWLWIPMAGCGVPRPDGNPTSFGVDFSVPNAPTPTRPSAIVFVVDGVNGSIFEEMLAAGELPALRRYFIDRGLYVRNAVASTPSVTLANETSLVTGLYPGHHGVTGINWFDRNPLIWRNYETIAQKNTLDGDYIARNLYEHFPDRSTYSLFYQPHRGTTKFFENWTSAGPPYFFRWYLFIDRLSLYRFGEMMDLARARGSLPALTIAYLLAPDHFAYDYGVSSEEYRESMRHTDRQIGRVLGDLERAGLLEETVLALVSDHSLLDVHHHFVVERFSREQLGLDVAPGRLWEKQPFEKRLQHYQRYSCVPYGSGDRYAALCLRKPVYTDGTHVGWEPWPTRPSADDLASYPTAHGPTDLLGRLMEQEAVNAVAWSVGPDRVRVRLKAGEVEFHQPDGPGGEITCRIIDGADPLGWAGSVPEAMLNGAPADPQRWFEASADTDYPDLPAQIVAYFRAQRAGDIALFAADGWDFNDVHHAGHGGLLPGDLSTPLLLAGPGVPNVTIDHARTVDFVPTLLQLLGRPTSERLDGQSLLPMEGE